MLRPSLALSAVALVLLVAPSSGNGRPDATHPVTVGSTRLAAGTTADLERRIEAAWLRDEARASGLRSGEGLWARVALALAAAGARGIPGAFNRPPPPRLARPPRVRRPPPSPPTR